MVVGPFGNSFRLELPATAENIALARVTVAAFASRLDPTVPELDDIRVAVSEAVTNVVLHAYPQPAPGAGAADSAPGGAAGNAGGDAGPTGAAGAGAANAAGGQVIIEGELNGYTLTVRVRDAGAGIPDVARARQPGFTTQQDRMGMGFAIMRACVDAVEVESSPGQGTCVTLTKRLARPAALTQGEQAVSQGGRGSGDLDQGQSQDA